MMLYFCLMFVYPQSLEGPELIAVVKLVSDACLNWDVDLRKLFNLS